MLNYYLLMPKMMAYFYLPYAYIGMMWMPWMYPYLAFFYKRSEGDRKPHQTAPTPSNNHHSKTEAPKQTSVPTVDSQPSNHHKSEKSSVSTVPETPSKNHRLEATKPTVETVDKIDNNQVKEVAEKAPEPKPIASVQPPEVTPPQTENVATPIQGNEDLKTARRLVNSMAIASLEDVDRLTLMRAKPLLKSLGISQSTNGKKKKVAELRDELKQKLSALELV